MGICAEFKGQVCFFVNIYSSCFIYGKRALWAELVDLKNRMGQAGGVCVCGGGGDFNSIRDISERKGR